MDVVEALKELAEPRPAGEPVKRAIERAARLTSFAYWRTFDFWYAKARRIEQSELDAITAALQHKREHDARNELHDLKMRIAKLEARLAAGDTDFYRPRVGAVRLAVCGVG